MKKQTDGGYIQWIFLALPVLWMGAVLAYAYEDGMNVFELLPRFAAAMEHPFAIGWTAHTPRFVLGALVVTMALVGAISRNIRRKGPRRAYLFVCGGFSLLFSFLILVDVLPSL